MDGIWPTKTKPWLSKNLANIGILVLFSVGLWISYKVLHHINFQQVYAELKAIPAQKVLLSMLLTACSYVVLMGYDWSGLKYINQKLPMRVVAFTSFVGFSISNTIGVSWLSGGALRYHLYSRIGLKPSDIAKVIIFCTVGFGLGEIVVGGTALIILPDALADYTNFPSNIIRVLAIGLILSVIISLFLRSRAQGVITFRRKVYKVPSLKILIEQIVLSTLDIALSGAALYVLLPSVDISFIGFLAIFALALAAGVISHVPGGVGVFEAVMVSALQERIPLELLVAALVCYRAIYYLFPFLLGIALLVGGEALHSLSKVTSSMGASVDTNARQRIVSVPRGIQAIIRMAIPPAFAGLTFITGMTLLFGSSMPLQPKLLELIGDVLPIEFVEISHLLGGVVGALLIVLSQAFLGRIRAALWIGIALVIAGAIITYLQTLDHQQALLMMGMAILLWGARGQFYRKAKLFSREFDLKWGLSSLGALLSFFGLLFFSFKAVPYQNDMWWQFTLDQQAPRGLRTGLVATSIVLIVYFYSALKRHRNIPNLPNDETLTEAKKIVDTQDNADGNFVLMADKRVLFSDNKMSFIMYAVYKKSWIALKGPMGGTPQDQQNLIWEFKAMASHEGCNTVFYEIGTEHMDWYIDAGLDLFKIGEDAQVSLDSFSLKGSARSKLRQAHNKALRSGLSFKMCNPPYSDKFLDQLSEISEQWLSLKHVREKSFSLGRFDRDYLQNFPIALVSEGGQFSAFANVMVTGTKAQATIDLMRHSSAATPSTMDYLFIELMLHLKEQGYNSFSLGMAPLSGFQKNKYGRLWDRFGYVVYTKGKRFYNFAGLRNFKNKYNPIWTPRYLATSRKGVGPYLDVLDIAALSSDGVKGIILK